MEENETNDMVVEYTESCLVHHDNFFLKKKKIPGV